MNGGARGAEETRRLTLALLLAFGLHAALWLGLPAEGWSLRYPRPPRLKVALLPPLEQPAAPAPTAPVPGPAELPTQPASSGTIAPSEPLSQSTERPPVTSSSPPAVLAPPPAPGPPPKPITSARPVTEPDASTRPAPRPAAPAKPPAVAKLVPTPRPAVKPAAPPARPARAPAPPAKPAPLPRTAAAEPPPKPVAGKSSPTPSGPAQSRPPGENPPAQSMERPARSASAGTNAARGKLDSTTLLNQIAGLDAETQRRASSGVRERRVSLADTRSLAGFYAADWARKVTRVGELNFPDAARRLNLSTGPLLEVAIRADGSLQSVRVLRSSGNPELDSAARRIVELAAPYPSFPPELRAQVELLRIEAPWRFDPGGRIRVR